MRTFRFPVDRRRERLPTTRVSHGRAARCHASPRMAMDCPTCGRPNADGKDFCDCGEYLRWDPTGVFAIPVAGGRRRGARHARRSPPAHATSAPPTPIPTEPVLLVLRAPGAPPGDGPPTIPLAVATSGLLQGFVRNQTKRVDSYALRVDGLRRRGSRSRRRRSTCCRTAPPATRHESHFLVTITPPRAPELKRRPSRLPARGRLARDRRGRGERSGRDRDPARTTSSSSRRFRRSAADGAASASRRPRSTTGNAPIEVELGARDREERFDLSFSPPPLLLEPNTPADAQLTAKPRRPHWIGRPREQTLAVTAHAPGVPPPPTQIVAVRQSAWLPFWLPPLLALIAALAAAFVLTRPETATMPALTGETFNAAQLATARAGFTQTPEQQTRPARRRAEIGTVVQPGAGRGRGCAARREARPRGRRRPRADPRAGPQGPRPRPGADRAAQGQAQARPGERRRREGRRRAPGPAAGRAGTGRHRRHGLARDAGEEADARAAGHGDRRAGDAAVAGRPAHARDRRHERHLDRSARDGRQPSPQRRAR